MKSDLTFFSLITKIGKVYTYIKASEFQLTMKMEFTHLAFTNLFNEVWLKKV